MSEEVLRFAYVNRRQPVFAKSWQTLRKLKREPFESASHHRMGVASLASSHLNVSNWDQDRGRAVGPDPGTGVALDVGDIEIVGQLGTVYRDNRAGPGMIQIWLVARIDIDNSHLRNVTGDARSRSRYRTRHNDPDRRR